MISFSLPALFVSILNENAQLSDLLTRNAAPYLPADQVNAANPQTAPSPRLFTVARPLQDEREDLLPYIIVQPNGIRTASTKDGGITDTCSIGLLLVATTYSQLVEMAQQVRDAIYNCMQDPVYLCEHEAHNLFDYNLEVSAVSFDPGKPCYFLTLNYEVEMLV